MAFNGAEQFKENKNQGTSWDFTLLFLLLFSKPWIQFSTRETGLFKCGKNDGPWSLMYAPCT